MQTDPVSAATHYQNTLKAIQGAKTAHEAKRLAARALDVSFAKPDSDAQISVTRGFGGNTALPFITLTNSALVIQMDTLTAREHALRVLEASDAAESDGWIVNWLRGGGLNLDDSQVGALLADFRAYRERVRARNEERRGSEPT